LTHIVRNLEIPELRLPEKWEGTEQFFSRGILCENQSPRNGDFKCFDAPKSSFGLANLKRTRIEIVFEQSETFCGIMLSPFFKELNGAGFQ